MAEANNTVCDGSEKDSFTLEQDEWFRQWNRLGRENLQSDQFQENQMMKLKKKLQNIEQVKQKLFGELQQEKQCLALLQEDFEKKIHELQYTKCQKEQLIIERDGILLQLEESEARHSILQNKLDEQSVSMQKIAQDFEIKLSQNEEIRQQLLNDLHSQDANYLKQCKQLEEKTEEWLNLKYELEKEREDMACPICFIPWEQTGHHRLVSLPCGHLFGEKCVNDHLSRLPECPICRSPAGTHNVRYIYGRNVIPNNRQ